MWRLWHYLFWNAPYLAVRSVTDWCAKFCDIWHRPIINLSCVRPYEQTVVNVRTREIPGHQPEMPDSVKLLPRDATYLGFHTDCLLKSIDWRFLYQNFIKIGQVVQILQVFEVKTNFLSMAEFSIKIMKESVFKFFSFFNSLSLGTC